MGVKKRVGIGCLGMVALGALFLLLPEKSTTERSGPYEFRFVTRSFAGHTGTSRSIYYMNGRKRTLVAKNVGKDFRDPNDASRLLYEYCFSEDEKGCGVFLFEAHAGGSRRVSTRYPIHEIWLESPWSPDGRAAAFIEQFTGTVVNLATGSTIEIAEPLALAPPGRYVSSAAWAADGTLAIEVGTRPANQPAVDATRETYVADPSAGTIRHAGAAR